MFVPISTIEKVLKDTKTEKEKKNTKKHYTRELELNMQKM